MFSRISLAICYFYVGVSNFQKYLQILTSVFKGGALSSGSLNEIERSFRRIGYLDRSNLRKRWVAFPASVKESRVVCRRALIFRAVTACKKPSNVFRRE